MADREKIIERLRDEAESADKRDGVSLRGLSKEARRALLSGATRH